MLTPSGSETVSLYVRAAVRPAASVAVTVKPDAPSAVGVPLTTPVAGSRVSPAGSVPVTANVTGDRPPAVPTVWRYGWPLVGAGSVAVVTASGSVVSTAKVAERAVRPSASIAVIPKANVPFVVGVPLTRPVAGSRLRPAGSVPLVTANVVGPRPPVVAVGRRYGTPRDAGATAAAVTASGSDTVNVTVWASARPLASVTWMVKLTVPAAVGVPVIRPVVGFSVRPAGSVPADTANVSGAAPPVAVTAKR